MFCLTKQIKGQRRITKIRSDARKSEIDLDLVMKQTANQIENSDDESIKEDEALKDISFSDLPVLPADSDIPVEDTPQTESPKVQIEMKEDTQTKKDEEILSNEKVIANEKPKPQAQESSSTLKADGQVETQLKEKQEQVNDNKKCNTEGELVGTQSSAKNSSEHVTMSEAMAMLSSPETQLQNKDVEIDAHSQQNTEGDQDEKRKELDNGISTDEYSQGHITSKEHTEQNMLNVKEVQPVHQHNEIIPESERKESS